jgi:hypothetical protein
MGLPLSSEREKRKRGHQPVEGNQEMSTISNRLPSERGVLTAKDASYSENLLGTERNSLGTGAVRTKRRVGGMCSVV